MQHIKEVYDKNPELLEKLFENNVDITTKIDGTAFQVSVSEDGEVEYRKRSGNSTKLGPIIDDYTRLFVGSYEKPIEHIESIKEVIKEKYKFLTFEIFKDNLILLSAITKDNELVKDIALSPIAQELQVKVVPVIWSGKLLENILPNLISLIVENKVPEGKTFSEIICDIFNITDPESYMIDNNLEGIVFNFKVGDKIAQYKLVDPEFQQKHKDIRADSKELEDKIRPYKQELVNITNKWLEENGSKLSDNKIESLDKNFIKMINSSAQLYNELMYAVSLIPTKDSSISLQKSRLSDDIKKLVNKKNSLIQKLYEFFIRTYYKTKSRNYITDKETQEKINSLIEKL